MWLHCTLAGMPLVLVVIIRSRVRSSQEFAAVWWNDEVVGGLDSEH